MRLSHRLGASGPLRGRGPRAAFALAFAAVLAAAAPLAAQNGQITGRVVDAATGRPLPSARVAVQGTQLAASTNLDGRYTLTAVPAGAHALTVALLGYNTKSVTGVQVRAAAATTQDVTLSAATLVLEQVTVTAQTERGSVGRALDEQRTAVGVVNAISAEQISRSPDSDAAQAMRRVSGVTVQDGRYVVVRGLSERYTTTTLNGSRIPSPEPERRVVPLDLFPAGLLQSVTTSKTFTPNLSGDFAGALVNIRTQEYPRRPVFTLSTSAGYNSATTGADAVLPAASRIDWLAMGAADRGVPGQVRDAGDFNGGITQPQYNGIVRSFRNAWTPESRTAGLPASLSASLGGSTGALGTELGYIGSLSYSRDYEVLRDYRRAQTQFGGEGQVQEIDRFTGNVGRVNVLWGGLLNLSAPLGSSGRISFNNTYNRSADVEGRRELGSIDVIDPSLPLEIQRMRTVERAVRSNQLRGEHAFGRNNLQWTATSSGVSRLEPDRSEFLREASDGTPRWYAQGNEAAVRTFGDLDENTIEASLELRRTFGRAGRHQVTVGGMGRGTTREAYNRSYNISGFGLSAEQRAMSAEQIFDQFSADGSSVFRVVPLGVGGSYSAEDRLGAGFAMLEMSVTDRLRLIGGARVEASDVSVESEQTNGGTSTAEPSYTDVLPALSLNYDVTDQQKVRVSVSQTLARPEYRELSDVIYRDVIGGDNVRGNPDLRRSLIQNLDVRWEWYPASDEIVSLAVFGKRFNDPIERVYLNTSGSRLVTFANAERAVNYGAELELRQSLGRYTAALDAFTVLANATFVRSEVTTVGEDDDRPMVGQSPYTLNAGLSFSPAGGPTTATVLYNVVGRRIVSAGEGLLPDLYELPRPGLDLSLRHAFGENLSVKMDAENLLDSRFRLTQGGVTRESYRTGRSVSLGVTWRR